MANRLLRLQLDLVHYARREVPLRNERANTQSFDDLLQRLDAALAGPGGAPLAARIRSRFRAALIDEFQDTDPIQYDIFRRVYHGSDGTLFLIGDPKQAIYAFRGADVFTYMDAGATRAGAHTRWPSTGAPARGWSTPSTRCSREPASHSCSTTSNSSRRRPHRGASRHSVAQSRVKHRCRSFSHDRVTASGRSTRPPEPWR